jgi:WD40 repeat protein
MNLSQICGFSITNFKHLKGDLIAVYGVQSMKIIDIKEAKCIGNTIETSYPITSVAYDSSANKIAIGTDKGKINIYTNFTQNKPQISTYHWHSMAVGALKFMDSRTLLSGGSEAVLVFWFEGSNRKDFCPRLYGSINGIFLD